jgi:hypothetical protein
VLGKKIEALDPIDVCGLDQHPGNSFVASRWTRRPTVAQHEFDDANVCGQFDESPNKRDIRFIWDNSQKKLEKPACFCNNVCENISSIIRDKGAFG